MPERITRELREQVARRARHFCEYCGAQARFSPDSFSIEHIFPRSKGGTNELSNLALACQGCNARKYTATEALDPVSQEMVRLYNPRLDAWENHFQWVEDCTKLVGLRPIGRATVIKLGLNRPALLNLRGVLFAAGEHPP